MSMQFSVDYTASPCEYTFLCEGWGIRDVGGPYICANEATVAIGVPFLSERRSCISLCLSASARLASEAAVVLLKFAGETRWVALERNRDKVVSFDGEITGEDPALITIRPIGCEPLLDVISIRSLSIRPSRRA